MQSNYFAIGLMFIFILFCLTVIIIFSFISNKYFQLKQKHTTEEECVVWRTPKELATIAGMETGLIPEVMINSDIAYDCTLFNKFWDVFEKKLVLQTKSMSSQF